MVNVLPLISKAALGFGLAPTISVRSSFSEGPDPAHRILTFVTTLPELARIICSELQLPAAGTVAEPSLLVSPPTESSLMLVIITGAVSVPPLTREPPSTTAIHVLVAIFNFRLAP